MDNSDRRRASSFIGINPSDGGPTYGELAKRIESFKYRELPWDGAINKCYKRVMRLVVKYTPAEVYHKKREVRKACLCGLE